MMELLIVNIAYSTLYVNSERMFTKLFFTVTIPGIVQFT
jgi:hypothetical protein